MSHQVSPDPYMIGVCGFGRCGSSMTMTMLDAGGVPVLGEPPSYEVDMRGVVAARYPGGQAVKLLDLPVQFDVMPYAPAWRFVWLDRDLTQQARSMIKFIVGTDGTVIDPRSSVRMFADGFRRDRPRALRFLRNHGAVTVLRYEQVLANPKRAARRLRDELWPDLDVDAAAAVVHRRRPECRPDLREIHVPTGTRF